VRKISEKSLSNVALSYLRKHSASRQGLTQVLERRVKAKLRGKDDAAELQGAKVLIEAVVERMVKTGYLDDARMAESKSASLQRQGKSSRVIQRKLQEKGIAPALAAKLAQTSPEQEFESACTLVKKKRLGVDPERKQKDFAVLMRAGFSSDLARRALLTAEVPEAPVEEEVEEAPVVPLWARGAAPGEVAAGGGQVLQFPGRAAQVPVPMRAAFAKPGSEVFSDDERARALAKKKRLGVDPARRQKDLAVLMRAGFRFDLAKRVLAGE
jgi:regulatory protein